MTRDRLGLIITSLIVLIAGLILTACGGEDVDEAATEAAGAVPDIGLFVAADIVQGSKNVPDDQKALRSCTLQSRFPRNSEMVWRARIVDPITGEMMDDSQITTAEVQLANGETVELQYGPHPKDPPNEFYWTGSWVVPKDYATGTLSYTILVTAADGRTGEFTPFSVKPSLPAIIDEVYPDAGA